MTLKVPFRCISYSGSLQQTYLVKNPTSYLLRFYLNVKNNPCYKIFINETKLIDPNEECTLLPISCCIFLDKMMSIRPWLGAHKMWLGNSNHVCWIIFGKFIKDLLVLQIHFWYQILMHQLIFHLPKWKLYVTLTNFWKIYLFVFF